jgi:hypothetical protein
MNDSVTKNSVKLPRRGPTIEVTIEGDEITTLYVNGVPVIVSPDVEKGDIMVKRGGTPEAYIMTDSFETLKRALKLLEPPFALAGIFHLAEIVHPFELIVLHGCALTAERCSQFTVVS